MLCETVEEAVHRPLYEIIQRDKDGKLESASEEVGQKSVHVHGSKLKKGFGKPRKLQQQRNIQ